MKIDRLEALGLYLFGSARDQSGRYSLIFDQLTGRLGLVSLGVGGPIDRGGKSASLPCSAA